MNLYKIMLQHFSQKDSEIGIITYLVANSDGDVYEWLKLEPKLSDGETTIYNSYRYNEEDEEVFQIYDDDYNVTGEESYKERMIRLCGDMFDESIELTDLYYGKTLYGWELVKEGVNPEVLSLIRENGINIEFSGGQN